MTPGLLHTVHFSDASNGDVTGEMDDGEARYFFDFAARKNDSRRVGRAVEIKYASLRSYVFLERGSDTVDTRFIRRVRSSFAASPSRGPA